MNNIGIRALRNWYLAKDYCQRGFNERPETFITAGLVTIASLLAIKHNITWPEGGYVIRYKERYMILRPDDERLIDYPEEFVTDYQWLKKRDE